jgi:parallel beta-helix repeat protein
MTLVNLIKRSVFCLLFISYTEQLAAKEYWVLPPSQPSESCTKKSCLCNKSNACALSNSLLKQLRPGDSVFFEKGIYPAFAIKNIHGTVEQPIAFNGSFSIGKAEVSLNPKKYKDLIEIKKSSHLILTGFNIHNSPRAGVRVNNSHHITVDKNKLTNNGVWGIFTNHSNHFIATNNTIVGPAKQHGIYHSNSGDNVKITSNFIQNFNGCGVHINGDFSMGGGAKVEGDGIISNVEIANNYFSGNGLVGGSAINLDGVVDGNINNNIIINNKAAGISIFKDDGAVGSSKIHVSDNLIIMPKGSRWAVNIKNSGGENLFTNNIMISQDSFRGIYDVLPVDLSTNNTINVMPFTANDNLYGYGRNLIALNDEHYLPLDEWQQDYKNDQYSSKILYKHIISHNGKLSQPLAELVQERKIAEFNSYLFLLF